VLRITKHPETVEEEPVSIAPLSPPYEPHTAELLAGMMPPGVEPIALYRTFAHNLGMARAMRSWGRYELSRELSLSLRQREIVIDRVCARLACEYEWGVHIAYFAAKAELTDDQVRSLTAGSANDPCWTDPLERALIEGVDQLVDTATIHEDVWARLSEHLSVAQLLDLTMLAGWYHAIAFTARAAGVPLEEWAPRFGEYATPAPPSPA
jgi:alkylhydroperoxidase family enzyme